MPLLRVAGPTLIVSLILFAACTATAVVLYRLHARTAAGLTQDIDSRKLAADIETTLRNLIALLQSGSDQVDILHEKLWHLLEQARDLADTDAEVALEAHLARSFERYYDLWQKRTEPSTGPDPLKEGLHLLQSEAVPTAIQLRQYDQEQIYKSEEALRGTIQAIAWALVAVGTIGSLGGVLFGYSVARALRHSMYKLSVSIRDAADKLREELPTVTLTEARGVDPLQEDVQRLVRDIERVVAELQQREREVLRAEQLAAVGQLAAGVAHELRNPLTAVKMLVQTSREDMEGRGLPAEDLGIIEQEIRRLERSLQTFLDFARPPRMERRQVDLARIVQEALALVGGRARKQHVKIAFDPPPEPIQLEADGEQLRQVVINLALNALDAMPHGGTLTLKLKKTRPDYVEVSVHDTGPGIAAEILPRLFLPFVSGKETGLGLGLVVSRRIAESHGGALAAAAAPQGGACFVLGLPLTAAPRPAGAAPDTVNTERLLPGEVVPSSAVAVR